jgi:hypothetical protein
MATRSSDGDFSFRSVAPMLAFDAALPYATYTLAKGQFPGIDEVLALGLTAIGPAVFGLYEIVRKRHVDIIGSVVLLGILVSIVATFIGGDPKVMLIRESFVTGALGVVCLLSLLAPKPLMFYVSRQFTAGQDEAAIAQFSALWQRPGARQVFRILTIVWGVGWVGEFLLRVLLVESLTIPQVLVIGPFLFNGITIALIAWTIVWTRYRRRLGEQADAAAAAAAASAQGATPES